MTGPSNSYYRYWLVVKPDTSKPTGGIKQLHRLAEALNELNREATLIQDEKDFHPGWFQSRVSTISEADWKNKADLNPERDIVIMPETYNGEFLSFAPKLKKIIFNQNTAYSFGQPDDKKMHRPAGLIELYRHPSIQHILCVSEHDKELLSEGFKAGSDRVSTIKNAIETEQFKPGKIKKRQLCYFTRKNARDSMIVLELLRQCKWFESWRVVPIQKMPQTEVAAIMQSSLLLLSFGHPEGFGLPVAEAMACGCCVIGYSGLGGRELFRLGDKFGTTQEIAIGDYLQFVRSTEKINHIMNYNAKQLSKSLTAASIDVRSKYNKHTMLSSLEKALSRIEKNDF